MSSDVLEACLLRVEGAIAGAAAAGLGAPGGPLPDLRFDVRWADSMLSCSPCPARDALLIEVALAFVAEMPPEALMPLPPPA